VGAAAPLLGDQPPPRGDSSARGDHWSPRGEPPPRTSVRAWRRGSAPDGKRDKAGSIPRARGARAPVLRRRVTGFVSGQHVFSTDSIAVAAGHSDDLGWRHAESAPRTGLVQDANFAARCKSPR
jgi:hypothetical protein